jgi:hypothetical protein
MDLAFYHIARTTDGWTVEHEQDSSPPYSTREAAFEAVVGAASNALRTGSALKIEVDAPGPGEPALGQR